VEAAKDAKEMTMAVTAVNELVLYALNQVIDCATGDLVEQYARLLLAGSYSAVRSAVRFLERDGTSQEMVGEVKESLDHVKRSWSS